MTHHAEPRVPKIRQMQWLGGKDAGRRVQIMDRYIPRLKKSALPLAIFCKGLQSSMVRRKLHSAEEVESIRQTCVFTIQIWQHDCTYSK